MNISKCRSCGAAIYWLSNESTGKLAPIDAKPSDTGNIAISLDAGTYQIASAPGAGLHVNHFGTCPQAALWKPKRGGAA